MADDGDTLETLQTRLASETRAKRGALLRAAAAEKRCADMLVDRGRALMVLNGLAPSVARVSAILAEAGRTKRYEHLAPVLAAFADTLPQAEKLLRALFKEEPDAGR